MMATTRGQQPALMLTDVAYILDVHPSRLPDLEPVCRTTTVHLGLADLSASVRMLSAEETVASALNGTGEIDLGWMLFDTRPPKTRFFRPKMIDGTIEMDAPDLVLAT